MARAHQLPLFPLDLVCHVCGETKPLYAFGLNNASRWGHEKQCRSCRNRRWRERHAANPQPHRDRVNAYRRAHPEVRERERVYEDSNRERKNQQFRARYAADPERYRAKDRAYKARDPQKWRQYHRGYYAADPAAAIAATRRWQKAHPDRVRNNLRAWHRAHPGWRVAANRRYLRRHPDQWLAHYHARRARHASAPGRFTAREWRALLDFCGHACLCCGLTTGVLSADHVIPLSRGGTNDIANMAVLCVSCNSRKGTASTDYRPWPASAFLVYLETYPYRRRPKRVSLQQVGTV